MRDFSFPGRSPVHGQNGMIATSHPSATSEGLAVLRAGGNAIDAAVAAAAVLAVVEPAETGIGGDCFVLFSPGGTLPPIAYNGSGRAPAAAHLDWFRERGIAGIELCSPHAVTVPGAVDAWCRLVLDHGTKSIAELLAPAIRLAEVGHVVHARIAERWAHAADVLAADDNARRIFLPDGTPPREGEVFRNPPLGLALRAVAERGRAGFYEGWVAEDIVTHLRALGGHHTLEDFAQASGEYVKPISTTYRDLEVFELPPNTQGLTALSMLKILEGFDHAGMDPLGPERFHLQVEAGRLAFAERDLLVGDPTSSGALAAELLSARHIDGLRARIDPEAAATDVRPVTAETSNTTYLSVVDRDLNAVSFINSLYGNFGSGLVSPRTGVLLQNRGTSFSLEAGHPGCIGPRRRPRHTLIPGLAAEDGHAVMPFGVMGGDYQPFGHVHFITSVTDFGCDLQEAADLPRLYAHDGAVEAERGIPDATLKKLQERGHSVVRSEKPLGGCQAVRIDRRRGVLTGASDPRKDGCALGF